MNLARKLCTIQHSGISRNLFRNIRFSAINNESTAASQPQVQEEKYDFEDLKVIERTERRQAKINPFMKDVFISIFNRELLAYSEIINKEENENMEKRLNTIDRVFADPKKTAEDRRNVLKSTRMYAAPVSWTRNGLAANNTESLMYLEAVSKDFQLAQELSDHWVGLQALRQGLTSDQYSMIIDDLISGENTIALAIKERIAERMTQADFRTNAEMDGQGIWHITGEKLCCYNSGYILVLCTIEGSRLMSFLVHPKAQGVDVNGNFINFLQTPATPLDQIDQASLAKVLAVSRLHAATLCRSRLTEAMFHVTEYVRPKYFGGKPLSEVSTIRSVIGDALVDIYASESAEYFTAGLLDGYEEPDAELEMAMCRNFMVNHGLSSIMKLISIPALDKEVECKRLFDDMRHLAWRGENLDSVNMYIALNGLHYAGTSMAQEIKQMRNPLLHPTFIFKKVLADRLQEKDDPKLNLHLAEHLHPSLNQPSEQLEYCVLRMRFACETLMARHGVKVNTAYTELNRLAEAATDILVMTSVLARASRSYCIGLRNSENEMKLAACFVEKTRDKVKKLIKEIDDGEYLNLDHFTVQFGRKILDTNSMIVEKPVSRSFW